DDLDELVLGVVDARDVVEGDLRLRPAVALGAAAAEPEPASAGHHTLIHPDEPHDQEERGAEAEKQVLPEGPALVERPRVDDHALLLEERLETGVGEGGQQRLEAQLGAVVTRQYWHSDGGAGNCAPPPRGKLWIDRPGARGCAAARPRRRVEVALAG